MDGQTDIVTMQTPSHYVGVGLNNMYHDNLLHNYCFIVCTSAFPVFAANLWNSLPANLTSAPSLTIFRQRLKTHLFRRSYPDLII